MRRTVMMVSAQEIMEDTVHLAVRRGASREQAVEPKHCHDAGNRFGKHVNNPERTK